MIFMLVIALIEWVFVLMVEFLCVAGVFLTFFVRVVLFLFFLILLNFWTTFLPIKNFIDEVLPHNLSFQILRYLLHRCFRRIGF